MDTTTTTRLTDYAVDGVEIVSIRETGYSDYPRFTHTMGVRVGGETLRLMYNARHPYDSHYAVVVRHEEALPLPFYLPEAQTRGLSDEQLAEQERQHERLMEECPEIIEALRYAAGMIWPYVRPVPHGYEWKFLPLGPCLVHEGYEIVDEKCIGPDAVIGPRGEGFLYVAIDDLAAGIYRTLDGTPTMCVRPTDFPYERGEARTLVEWVEICRDSDVYLAGPRMRTRIRLLRIAEEFLDLDLDIEDLVDLYPDTSVVDGLCEAAERITEAWRRLTMPPLEPPTPRQPALPQVRGYGLMWSCNEVILRSPEWWGWGPQRDGGAARMIARGLTVDEISQVIEDAERIAADLEARAEASEARG